MQKGSGFRGIRHRGLGVGFRVESVLGGSRDIVRVSVGMRVVVWVPRRTMSNARWASTRARQGFYSRR